MGFYSIIFIALASLSAWANSENDRREAYGNGGNNDGAAYVGDQKTKQQLTPRMTDHYTKASTYFAMGNIPMGTIEQTKGDLLKAQIKANGDSADKNRNSEKLVNEIGDAAENRDRANGTTVITVDQDRASVRENTSTDSGSAPMSEVPVGAAAPFTATQGTTQFEAATPIGEQLATLRDRAAVAAEATGEAGATTSSGTTVSESGASGSTSSTTTTASEQVPSEADSRYSPSGPTQALPGGGAIGQRESGSLDEMSTILLPGESKTALDKDFFATKRKKESPIAGSRGRLRPRVSATEMR